jgi:uncharacterized membrane protein YgaE (UPF0421/DUF939 family)
MEKEKIIEIINDVQNKSNKDLLETSNILEVEFNKTKELIIDLTRHLDTVEKLFDTVNNEIEKRTKK